MKREPSQLVLGGRDREDSNLGLPQVRMPFTVSCFPPLKNPPISFSFF